MVIQGESPLAFCLLKEEPSRPCPPLLSAHAAAREPQFQGWRQNCLKACVLTLQFVAIRQCQAEALPGLRLSLSTGVPATVGTQPFVLPRAALGSANAYVGLGRVTQGSG